MKYYNFETMFLSLAEKLKEFLENELIRFEISGAGACYHFEILADEYDAAAVNDFLNSVTITAEVI
jgi:hypothetical protein